MAKKIMQDMVVRKKTRRASIEEKKEPETKKASFFDKKEDIKIKEKTRLFLPKLKFGLVSKLIIILFLAAAFVFALRNFSWVTLIVAPKQDFINIDTGLEAFIGTTQDINSFKSSKNNNIYFELMEVSEEKEKTVKSSGAKDVEKKASGQIIIYNSYSSAPQILVKRTRFSAPDGKIYRIDDQIVVPGAKISGGSIIPSSIEVTVYADEPGEEYNIGLVDFTIPGFKGDARYGKFYARSKTDMMGGFIGKLNVVSGDEILVVKDALRDEIKKTLVEKVEMSVPNGFLYYSNLTMLNFISSSDNHKDGDEAENFIIKEKGVLKAFLIRETDLSNALVSKYAEDAAPIRISNLREMPVSLVERNKENDKIVFSIKGDGHFVWNIDSDSLKRGFLEKKGNKAEAFKDYPIEKAEVKFHPSWWRFIPKDGSRVKYEEVFRSGLD